MTYNAGDRVRITKYESAAPVGTEVEVLAVSADFWGEGPCVHYAGGPYGGDSGDAVVPPGDNPDELWYASYDAIELATPAPALIDQLAADIRAIDGNHDTGAGALAEALVQRGWRK